MGKPKPNKKSKGKNRTGKKGAKPFKKERKIPKEKKKWRGNNKEKGDKTEGNNSEDTKSKMTAKNSTGNKGNAKLSLRDKMMKRLNAARFRQLNEDLDSVKNSNPIEAFGSEKQVFAKYHEAYRERVEHWPVDPLNVIVDWIKDSIPDSSIIVDFGCGEARLAQSVPHQVHSFDLFALNEHVTACDMSDCPLENESVDVAIFCLSLMGIDIAKFICEANRVLKKRGTLKIAEVASRFQDNNYSSFVQKMKKFGFVMNVDTNNDTQRLQSNGDVFFMFDFRKIRSVNQVNGKIPVLKLQPCIYKRR